MTGETSCQTAAEAAAAAMFAADGASREMGMSLDFAGPGAAHLSMTVRPDMIQGLRVCHGGYIFALADSAMAFASNTESEPALAQTCQVTYLAPAKEGDRLTARAQEVTIAGRTKIYDVEVTDQTGRKIAVFRGQTRTVRGTNASRS
jgi:acyl-CoA thioesterase